MRVTKAGVWSGASSTTIVFMVLAWVLPNVLGLEGTQLWILRGALAFLGLSAGVLVYRMLALRERRSGPRVQDPEAERLDQLLREARSRLASAETADTSRLSRLPILLVLGPPDSTKTTTVLQSGMNPELLAGEVHRGDTIVPTEAVNLWYGDGVVVVEAGGAISDEASRWARLVQRLRPARLGAALLRRSQAPRVALLCVSCDELLRPGASSSLLELARGLRARLSEASREMGIQLPVYVLFTKADRLPHFAEFVRNLHADEAEEALGATLPLRVFSSSGTYADEQSRRVGAALEELHRSLARKRLDFLPRENDEEVRQAAYEFPREMAKLADPIRDFLVELCRPGHLGSSPVLRGFYFTGVRAIYLTDQLEETRGFSTFDAPEVATAGATSVFSAERIRQEAERQRQQGATTTRKVPQWVFLRRVIHDVILGDRAAMGLTGSGVRVSFVRRAVLGATAAAALVVIAGMFVSFFTNRGLQHDAAAALRGVEAPSVASTDGDDAGGIPLHHLRQLDSVGSELDRLRDWEEGRPPLRYRWGLYRGSRLLPDVRLAYFHRFQELLWSDTRAGLVTFLQGLPPEPEEDSDYEATYDALRAYLITTEHPDRSDIAFLSPVLLGHWSQAAGDEDEATELARRQFVRFARELQVDNPYGDRASESLVAGVRGFLGEFAAVDRFYQALVSRVSTELPAFRFADRYPGAESAFRNDLEIRGAYTQDGWAQVQEILDDPDALLVSEEWVVGEQAVSAEERVALAREIETRYVRDYVARWQDFLRAGSVRAFSDPASAASILHILGGNDSPIVHMLEAVSRHTAVNSDEVRAAFQPVHHLVPPPGALGESEDSPGSNVTAYLDGLVHLRSSLDQLPGASGGRLEQGVVQAERDATEVERTIAQLARDFERDGSARAAGDAVERVLEEPVTYANRLLSGYEATQAAQGVNQQGQALCTRFGDITGLYPFSPGASTDVQVDDLKALFQPGQSRLSSFHDEVLGEMVTQAGGRYEAGAGVSPRPTAEFLSFYNRADRIARALFTAQGEGPRAVFYIRIEASGRIPEVQLELDGQQQLYTPTAAPFREFVWNGEQARMVRLTATVDGARMTLVEEQGPWAVFRLFQGAGRWAALGGGGYRVSWPIPGQDLEITADVSFAEAGMPVFQPGFLAELSCVSRVVQ
ncbi:MAG: type VI secretion system membrane subunit TssM [Gemmatimonadota bacterium]